MSHTCWYLVVRQLGSRFLGHCNTCIPCFITYDCPVLVCTFVSSYSTIQAVHAAVPVISASLVAAQHWLPRPCLLSMSDQPCMPQCLSAYCMLSPPEVVRNGFKQSAAATRRVKCSIMLINTIAEDVFPTELIYSTNCSNLSQRTADTSAIHRKGFLADTCVAPSQQVGSVSHDAGEWNVFYLFLHSERFEENCARCPK